MRQVGASGSRRSGRRRGVSGLGLVLVILGLLALAVTFARVPPVVFRLWPLILVAVGAFGLVRRPGWVEEMDVAWGSGAARTVDRPRRIFSLAVAVVGAVALLFTMGLVDGRVIGPALLVGLGLLFVWRRAR